MGDLKRLSEPFPPEDVEWFIGVTTQDKQKGLAIPFITNRAVQERLDQVCGPDGWKNEYEALGEREYYERGDQQLKKKTSQLCGISIWSELRGEWITKWDGAEESDIEAIKGSLSSAMKRAAVQWGIGRYLYYIESPWVEIEPQGRSYRIKANQIIKMPGWALPGGTGKPGINDQKKPYVEIAGYNAAPRQTQQQAEQQAYQPRHEQRQGQQQQQANTANYGAQQQAAGGSSANYQAGKLTAKQVNRALRKGEAAGQSQADIENWCTIKYGIGKIEDLSRQQYDELCAALDRNRIN